MTQARQKAFAEYEQARRKISQLQALIRDRKDEEIAKIDDEYRTDLLAAVADHDAADKAFLAICHAEEKGK